MIQSKKNIKRELTSIQPLAWAEFKCIDVVINQKKILSNINTKLNYGENVLILGPNGSGKSTFLKLINRSIYPIVNKDSSLKLFNEENINIWDLRRKIGFLFSEMQERVSYGVKVYDLISSGFTGTFNSRYSNMLTKEEYKIIDILIQELDLSDFINKEFANLSEGQKRRSLLARGLVYRPGLLVLDEPFTNLDIKSSYLLNKILIKLMNASVNIVYVTHSLESIIPKTNRVLLMKDGQIIDDGSPKEIITSINLSELFNISIEVTENNDYWRGIPIIS